MFSHKQIILIGFGILKLSSNTQRGDIFVVRDFFWNTGRFETPSTSSKEQRLRSQTTSRHLEGWPQLKKKMLLRGNAFNA